MEKGDLVIKHNDLIEARYDLNPVEQKIILYAVTKIDTNKDKFGIIQIEATELAGLMQSQTGRYKEFREVANDLMNRKVYLKDRPNLDVRWLASSEYIGNGIIELEFSEKLIPYLLQLKKKFTRYQIGNILMLENKYSIRIYELMKQYEKIGTREFELSDFKNILMLDGQYERIYDFERFVLKPSMIEINGYTDIIINYEKVKKGRKVIGLFFTIESKIQNQVYIDYLNEQYDIEDMKEKMGIKGEHFNEKQVLELYEKAIIKTESEDIDPFEYVKLNYLHMIGKGTARNKFSYLMAALEDDYATAAGYLSFLKKANEA
jgi:plasmid replication initiation protein